MTDLVLAKSRTLNEFDSSDPFEDNRVESIPMNLDSSLKHFGFILALIQYATK
jgi:hypothetical protein